MKKFLMVLAAAFVALAAWGQTPEEILQKMSETMDRGEKEGMAMTMDMKVPILGTMSMRVLNLGQKSRISTSMMGRTVTMWDDGATMCTYSAEEGEITIEDSKTGSSSSEADDNLGLAKGVTDGYDAVLKSETADAWFFECKKQKSNKDKDAPKKMDISVWKDSYCLREMSASVKGVKVMLRDISFDVKEEDVSFDISRFPDAKVTDKRVQE